MSRQTRAAFIFPGQGSHTLGMGVGLFNEHPVARNIFTKADETLGFDLSKLCFEGPEEELVKTINIQPAILTVSIACMAVAKEISDNCLPKPEIVAGHSLGEYTALVAAGALEFCDAVKLVRERGRLMYEAGQKQPGGMAAVIGLEEGIVTEICKVSGAEISNINSPGQIVISGTVDSLDKSKELIKAKGGARIIPLKVSGAFHSTLMRSAAEGLKGIINRTGFRNPEVPIVANMNAELLSDFSDIKNELNEQLLHCVQWQKSVKKMISSGVNTFIEFGSGQVLTNLVKRIDPAVGLYNIGDRNIAEQVKTLLAGTAN